MNKNNNSNLEKKWLNKKFKQYGVANRDLSTLKIRMDEVPVSMAIAQAAKKQDGELQGSHKRVMHCLVNGLGREKELNLPVLKMVQHIK